MHVLQRRFPFLALVMVLPFLACEASDPPECTKEGDCQNPPQNTCDGGDGLAYHLPKGHCTGGRCEYDRVRLPCPHGCDPDIHACRGCQDDCSLAGATSCGNGEVAQCSLTQEGCLAWTNAVPCPDGTCAAITESGSIC